ncbi:ferritin-like fold-containing protein [Brevibacterium epidermidis]|uniref:ferritin-like fold-containing protein n=1 Tax=Brevibacterium epidermidis TaxID=1698 RepID=UPI000780C70B|nr:ferritin-like fold-containing protein [Brevibacterium epidermidis]
MSDSVPLAGNDAATLALLAFGELTGFERMATNATTAADLDDKVILARLASQSFANFEQLSQHIDQMGQDVIELCQHFEPTFSTLAERTRPRDWYESLMKGFVFDGIMNDFYRTAVDELAEPGYSLAIAILDDTRASEYARNRLTSEVAVDTQLASRLALWGRKLVAETLGRARSLLTDPFLGLDEDLVVELIPAVTSNHSKRMSALGLVA